MRGPKIGAYCIRLYYELRNSLRDKHPRERISCQGIKPRIRARVKLKRLQHDL